MKLETIHNKEIPENNSATHGSEINSKEQNNQAEMHMEILESPSAQDIMPYLTLDKLNEQIETDLFILNNEMLGAMRKGILPEDKFTRVSMIENMIADISGETDSWKSGRITPKLAQARKLFCASLINSMGDNGDSREKWEIYKTFFGMSPGLDSYCGGLQGSLELLMIAKRTNENPFTNELYDGIIYDYSFAEVNGFKEVFEGSDPIKQLRLLPIFNSLALRCDPNGWSHGALDKITKLLDATKTDSNTAPLVKLVAEGVEQNVLDWFNSEWTDIDTNNPEHARIVAEHEQRVEDIKQEQGRLHDEFPNLPIDHFLVRIAPGFAATLDGDTINMISNKEGATASLLNYQLDNPFGLNRDMAFLIGASHNPGIRELISTKLKMDLEDIPFEAQKHLLKYMTEADNKRFDRLCGVLKNVDKKLRLKLAENFLAADFGDDFGDALLDIANSERISKEEIAEILDTVDSCRNSISGITEFYHGLDGGDFASEYTRAANERLTDAIAVFREIATNGEAKAELGRFGNVEFDYDSAMEALRYEMKSLKIINGTMGDLRSGKEGTFAETVLLPDLYHGRSLYNFYSPNYGYVLLYTRPEGSESFDPALEYGKFGSRYSQTSKNTGVEASISLITNPIDPFSLPNPFKPDSRAIKNQNFYDSDRMDKVSAIRLDREGRAPGMAANDPERSPLNQQGMVSVDLAAIGDRVDTPSGKIARLFSAGNALRMAKIGGDTALNHNTAWFNQSKYGTSDGFKDIVEYIDDLAKQWCEENPPKETEGFRGAKRKANKNRGHKIITGPEAA